MSRTTRAQRRETDRMSDIAFRVMILLFRLLDFVYPYIDKRVKAFGIRPGMTVVDYGCGPGRYTLRFAGLVGQTGKVYAVDVHELAIEAVSKKVASSGLGNVETALATGYESGLSDDIADVICALDMFFGVRDPSSFLAELHRILKPDGVLVIDDGHQSRKTTKRKIAASGQWAIREETKDHLKCTPQ